MDRCLYGLYARPPGRRRIDARLVRTAAAQSGALPARRRRSPALAAAASVGVAACLVLAGLGLRGAESRADDAATAAATAPTADAVPVGTGFDPGWQGCLQRFARGQAHLQPVSDAWAQRLAGRADVCLRREAGGWSAAWPVTLRAEHFVSAAANDRVREVQALLRGEGLYDGALDGLYGPRTRQALARFQAGNGLPATGAPDPATLFLLDERMAGTASLQPPHTPPTSTESTHHGHG
ncbi:hypothetical protein B1992_04665 [Pseudoxanthomonas broegbernensis]|uniref:Peptidoglycan binding-like domain-containing protein n=2 Tax=Pseudoxanthomonas broegbernensis TaxID=83619 RepID=A0A7V8GP69_9GAMM|nr:hypothetical protein B1992_04665 [Pseudoxanthomonas broegbernensis]